METYFFINCSHLQMCNEEKTIILYLFVLFISPAVLYTVMSYKSSGAIEKY
jgi:hypothetical protein